MDHNQNEQHITIVDSNGAVTEFAGDNYQLVTATMGLKMVFDEGPEESTAAPVQVWSQFGPGGPVGAEVTITNPRADYVPSGRPMSPEVATGLAPFVATRGRRR